MALSLNVTDYGNTLHKIVLGGIGYNMRVAWNTRSKKWEMDLSFTDGRNIAKGITLLPNAPIVEPYLYTGFSGRLIVLNTRGDGVTNLNYDNLGYGKSFELIWVSEEEIDEYSQ
jgi:hypothetical protein